MRRHGGWTAVALGLTVALASCDSGPEGPGVLNASVVASEAMGAVVLEFTGTGILGFEGQGNTLVYHAAAPGAQRHRVILVSPSGPTEIRFGIDLEDRAGELPAVAAVSAASPTNAPLSGSGLKVRIER